MFTAHVYDHTGTVHQFDQHKRTHKAGQALARWISRSGFVVDLSGPDGLVATYHNGRKVS